jgi:hypothetical protein
MPGVESQGGPHGEPPRDQVAGAQRSPDRPARAQHAETGASVFPLVFLLPGHMALDEAFSVPGLHAPG